MKKLLFTIPGHEVLSRQLLTHDGWTAGQAIFRHFPDGESYVHLLSPIAGHDVYLLCSLHQPDEKVMWIYYFARLARQLGARTVRLLAPYLGYMRQDKAFHPGEAVTADLFAELLSQWVDGLITIDPHLHRHHQLSEIYTIPTLALHAGPLIADYLRQDLKRPVLLGPDAESKQWVAAIAEAVGCDFTVLRKERLGDKEVRVTVPDAARFRRHTPVLVDDIISTGHTMIEAARHLQDQGIAAPVCIGIHAVFAGPAWVEMRAAGIETIITTNTIPHPSNHLDISNLLTSGVNELVHETAR